MMLIDNIYFLRKSYQGIREQLKKYDDQQVDGYQLVHAKNEEYTIEIQTDKGKRYIHSKYNPTREANTFVKPFKEEVDEDTHVIFYGVGLGYHIKEFLRLYKIHSYSLYEPIPYLFYQFLSVNRLEDIGVIQPQNIFLEEDFQVTMSEVETFAHSLNRRTLIVALPSYKQLFQEQFKQFGDGLSKILKNRMQLLNVNAAYEQRWIINSLKNFPQVLNTPNILYDIDQNVFKDKPAIIVSAGPSLNEEFEHLRKIKQEKSAYIFTVGSAINALIEQGIMPNAALTYDPSELNQVVFQKMKDKKLTDIPVIFGSSVGHETLLDLKNPKAHFITSQDSVSAYTLKRKDVDDLDVILDAPSIAVLVLQLLSRLGASPIVLVGQNLAFLENHRYAEGIQYQHIQNELMEKEKEELIAVTSNDGTNVYTNDSFQRMKRDMELAIKQFAMKNIINTTKKGTVIQGTTYIPLEKIMNDFSVNMINEDWFINNNKYDLSYIRKQWEKLDDAKQRCEQSIKDVKETIDKMKECSKKLNTNQLRGLFAILDNHVNKTIQNLYYKMLIGPMVRVQYDFMSNKMKDARLQSDLLKKASMVTEAYSKFIQSWMVSKSIIDPIFMEVKEQVLSQTGERKDE